MSQNKSAFEAFSEGIDIMHKHHEGGDFGSYLFETMCVFLSALRFKENRPLYDEYSSSNQTDIYDKHAAQCHDTMLTVVRIHQDTTVK